MSGTRLARSGRCRIFAVLCAALFMFVMVAFFHSSQQALEETREKRLRCEQQQDAVNEQLQSMVEQKHSLEKTHEHERTEQMEARRNLEQKMKELTTAHAREQMEARVRYDKLQQAHKLLQSEHNELVGQCDKSKKQLLEETNAMEKKLQAVRAEAQKEKHICDRDMVVWKEKYNAIVHEKERLELLLNAADSKVQLQRLITDLQHTVSEYKLHCDYKPKTLVAKNPHLQQQLNKPLNPPDTMRSTSAQPRQDKSFNEQVLVSPGLYHIGIKITNHTQKAKSDVQTAAVATNHVKSTPSLVGDIGVGGGSISLPFSGRNNRSLIINSVENFQILPKALRKLSEETETQLKQQPQNEVAASVASAPAPVAAAQVALAGEKTQISPLSAPRKPTSTTSASKSAQNVLEANANLKQATNTSVSSAASSSLPPLPVPPANQRKIPENVAPIPANFDELIKNDPNNQKANGDKMEAAAADIDAALEEMQKNDNDDGQNNRYANVVNDMESKGRKMGAAAAAANEDSGAHEIKDHDFMNDQNFNLPAEEDNNFFDGGGAGAANAGGGGGANAVKLEAGNAGKAKEDDNEDEEGLGAVADAGDIAVKNHNHLLDADNLNNEVAGDQGKEFPDGLRLEEGNDEDEDEDDYSNPAARQQGEQAIRN